MSLSVSIIIPSYNAEKTLEKCLESVFFSIGPSDEVIVVNDASSDRTNLISKNFNCKLINLLENGGAAHARNQGVKEATKDLIIFVDSDILISKKYLDKIKFYFFENKNVHSLTMNVEASNLQNNFFTDFKNLYMNFIISESKESVNYIYGSFCATRRSGYVSWPETLRLTEDSLWGYKQKSLGLEIHCLKDIQVTHLKDYNFFSLIKNDFNISSYFAKSFIEFNRWNTLYTDEAFGHTSKTQKISVGLAALSSLSLLINPVVSLSFFLIWLICNGTFFKFIHTNKGLSFTLKSITWYFLAYNVYFLGICHGTASHLSNRSKLAEREIA